MFVNIRKAQKAALLICAACMVSACTPTVANRGHIVDTEDMSDIVAGRDTQRSVVKKIGSPSTISTLDPSIWYYIGLVTEKRGILDPKQTDKKIVRLKFDAEGKVAEIAEVTRDNIDVPISQDKTETGGNKVTIMQQFFGNLGKFNTAGGNE
ncbi:MAG: outer membrane protein assembly factor BamE [Alphaproteobacteria bacterium]|nr:cell envelope protein SmpA [Alphaproteobacteria bacterium]MCS5596227.1 outer membrane protein assembly factor BamE [Alphaproteobacteria bacterium]|tara:strand:+ start:4767 stop:5222 length:456 start_codon:yes stop_codon:yes gene_type:complete